MMRPQERENEYELMIAWTLPKEQILAPASPLEMCPNHVSPYKFLM